MRRILPWGLVVVLALSHVWLATLRYPMPAATGKEINPPPGGWPALTGDSLRVSAYNIHRAKDEDGKRDIRQPATLLVDDDIAGLQEVLGPGIFSDDQAEQLGQILNVGWIFAPIQTQYYQPYIGNALISRVPVSDWDRIPLPKSDQLDGSPTSRAYRNMLKATIQWKGVDVVLLVTHLDRGKIRVKQLRQVLEEAGRYTHSIVLADLNTRITSTVAQELLETHGLTDAYQQAVGATIDDERRIDWIVTKGFKAIEGGTVPVGISDHPYYWVRLKLSES
ncbi:MAG: endonuclease/exonuclease/phosphatase family protein [Pseudomonadota bacterium]